MDLQKSDAKILLRCMVAMASADEKLHAEEISVISAVFEKIAGHPLDETLLHDMFEIGRDEQLAFLRRQVLRRNVLAGIEEADREGLLSG